MSTGSTSSIGKGGRLMAATLFAMFACAEPASAGSFQVNPVNIRLAPNKATSEIMIGNVAKAPVAVRVTALKWTQLNGRDVYEPTTDVIASPPIFTMAAGARQVVRIGLRRRLPGAAYRVILQEIPGPSDGRTGIKVALRLNLPLYILASDGAPSLSWTAARDAAGELFVEARNAGPVHSQVTGIEAQDAAGKRIGSTSAMGVVLPQSARRWTLGKGAGTPADLLIRGPKGVVRSKLSVERP